MASRGMHIRHSRKQGTNRVKAAISKRRIRKKISHTAMNHKTRMIKRQNPQLPAYGPASYNGALVYDIALGVRQDRDRVPEEALLLGHVLLNLTPSSSTLAYRSGFSVGSTLYELELTAHPKPMYGEYVPYLVEFLEHAGYRVTYSVFPDQSTFRFHGPSIYLGAKVHTFEAGIIAGFLSAARHTYVGVNERECRNAGARECTFTTSITAPRQPIGRAEIDRLINHVQAAANSGARSGGTFLQSYHALISSAMLDNASLDTLKDLMAYIGSSLRIRFDSMRGRKPGAAKYISNAVSVLGLGAPSISDMRKLGIRLSFGASTSRHGWVELSVAFLNGIIGKGADTTIATESNKNSLYTITLARRPVPRIH